MISLILLVLSAAGVILNLTGALLAKDDRALTMYLFGASFGLMGALVVLL